MEKTFIVEPHNGMFRIREKTSYANGKKRKPSELYGYLTENAAKNDVLRYIQHTTMGNRRQSFVRCFTNHSNVRIVNEERKYYLAKELYMKKGNAARLKAKLHDREYAAYKKLTKSAPANKEEERALKETWMKEYYPNDAKKDRLYRTLAREPKTVHTSVLSGLRSEDSLAKIDSLKSSLVYFKDRKVLLLASDKSNQESLELLRKSLFSGRSYELILKAKFDEDVLLDSDRIDLAKEDEVYTYDSCSKAQLARVTLQSCVTERFYNYFQKKIAAELSLVDSILSDVGGATYESITDLAKSVQQVSTHWEKIKCFKLEHSMESIAKKVHESVGGQVSVRTMLKWLQEFRKYAHFKEDLRGCYQRKFFLEEFGLKNSFVHYLKGEKKLTVDTARKNLETIMSSHLKKTAETREVLDKMLPLSNTTIHRWMTTLGCKYEKASASYYTDSHEAESTKKDFKERFVLPNHVILQYYIT